MLLDLQKLEYHYLTIPKNTDRIAKIEKQFSFLNINQYMNPNYPMTYKLSGALGWLGMIEKAYPTGYTSPKALLEDDAGLCGPVQALKIPEDADLLYIGISRCALGRKAKVNYRRLPGYDDIYKVTEMLSTHGIVVCSQKGIDILRDSIERDIEDDNIFDITLSKSLVKINAYALRYPMVYQTVGNTDYTRPDLLKIYGKELK